MADLRYGRIVWVELLDPQGRNPKVRPAVVLTPTAEITPAGHIFVAAITSDVGSVPAAEAVELPWQASGHPTTKLKRASVVVTSWTARVDVSAARTAGMVPLKQLMELASKIAMPSTPPAAPPTPP